MRRIYLILLLLSVVGSPSLFAQTSSPPPQSARQALIEMFMGKGGDDFARHLPEAARQALIHKGETPESSFVLKFAQIGRQMPSEHVEAFDIGPNILVSEQNDGREKIEIAVEHDSLMGEEEEIELSLHVYKDGQLQSLPVLPRLIFTMKQEKEVWRLTELTAAVHVPLTDPDYLKGVRKQQDGANETAAQMRVGVIATAETGYAGKHPERGYTCSLPDLFARDTGTVPGEDGNIYDPGQAGDEWSGYRFTLSGCDGNPPSKYRIAAEPAEPDSEMKTFCSDESGIVKSVAGGKGSTCFNRGKPVNAEIPVAYWVD